MKSNLGTTDKIVRVMAAIVISILSLTGIINGILSTILLVVAALLVITSLINLCPIYLIFGISTKRETQP